MKLIIGISKVFLRGYYLGNPDSSIPFYLPSLTFFPEETFWYNKT